MHYPDTRTYGLAPFRVAVLHGGPGAPGYMAPVARELASTQGVLEPLQKAFSLEGQLNELHDVLEKYADSPVAIIGSSWGAMLGYIFAARYPEYARKLILVGSGVYETRYAESISPTRMARLDEDKRNEAEKLKQFLDIANPKDKPVYLKRYADLLLSADAFEPLTNDLEILAYQPELNEHVWRDAAALRRNGGLLALGKQITCPVVAIHGDYDPHPVEGVREPLTSVLTDFRMIILEKCGHYPWIERHARNRFFEILNRELEQ